MRPARCLLFLLFALTLATPFQANATNGAASYSGGSFSTGTAVGTPIKVTSAAIVTPVGTLSFSCPITTYAAGTYALNWTCAGGSVTIASSNHSLAFSGAFLSGAMAYTSSGGGKGGHTTSSYHFHGAYSGTLTSGAVRQLVYGSVDQTVDTNGQLGSSSAPVTSGSSGWNSGYSPLLVADAANSRLLLADNIAGANLIFAGSAGTGINQFGTVAGLAQDAASSLYATDSDLDRVVRIDRSTQGGWTTLGSKGAGTDHFLTPRGIAIGAGEKIWVADSGNNRIARFNDMTGAGWTTFGTSGASVHEFNAPSSIAFDPKGRIYVADTGNNRLVRFDDIAGKNWTSLTHVTIGKSTYPLTAPSSIATDAAGKVYIALGSGYLLRVDDINGANGVVSYWGGPLTAVSVDNAGTIYVGGDFAPGLAQVVDVEESGYFASALGAPSLKVSALLALSTTNPPPAAPAFSVNSLSFGNQNVGHATPAKTVTVTNLGAAPLVFQSLSRPGDYPATAACPASLPGGASCTGTVSFRPVGTGSRNGTLVLQTNGAHPSLRLPVSGTGTSPQPVLLPTSLSFDPQRLSSASGTQLITLTNNGSGPLTVKTVSVSGAFTQASNCVGVVPAGGGCTLQVAFKPTASGTQTGSITITDDATAAGTTQVVSLSGIGTSSLPAFTLSPESLQFPAQQVDTTSGTQTITLTNASGSSAALSAPTYPPHFTGSTNCGKSLANGAGCNYSLTFSPTNTGPATASFAIPLPAKSALSAALSGTGVAKGHAPALSITPASLAFGIVNAGDDPSLSTTLLNTSGLITGVRSVSLAGDSTFSLTGNTCPSVLAGHSTCTIAITFRPLATSAYSNTATLTITESSGAITSISVAGYAIATAAATSR